MPLCCLTSVSTIVAHELESRVVSGLEKVQCDSNPVVRRAHEHDLSKVRRIPRADGVR